MSIRTFKRKMMHCKMNNDKLRHINKPIKFGNRIYPSYFARNWRTYNNKGETV